jgi:hypothetical protein
MQVLPAMWTVGTRMAWFWVRRGTLEKEPGLRRHSGCTQSQEGKSHLCLLPSEPFSKLC